MIEAMLWTMAEPLLAAQLGAPPQPRGNKSDRHAPHGIYRCAGEDDWVGIAVTGDDPWRALCASVSALAGMAGLTLRDRMAQRETIDAAIGAWTAGITATAAAAALSKAGIPAATLARSRDLVESGHLRARGFWDVHDSGVLPGLPWRASFGKKAGRAPGLGADTDDVLRDILQLGPDEIAALRRSGALG
jgi:crotonobetainyl-CoA:carnitine CoA-transferase CaiB-like acyl-CoA transferase